jgi:hypothetical protein
MRHALTGPSPRTKANHIKGERRLYVFDLDTQEEQEGVGSDSDDIVMLDAAPSELWSVDAYETGGHQLRYTYTRSR